MLQISTCTYGFIRTAIPRTLLAVASKLLKSLKFLLTPISQLSKILLEYHPEERRRR